MLSMNVYRRDTDVFVFGLKASGVKLAAGRGRSKPTGRINVLVAGQRCVISRVSRVTPARVLSTGAGGIVRSPVLHRK